VLILLVGILLGGVLSWMLSPSPSEQLAAERDKTAEQDRRIRALQSVLDRVDPIVRNKALAEQSLAQRQAALDARSRDLDRREAQIAQREQALAGQWSIPKPSAQDVEGFFRRTSDSISQLLNRVSIPRRIPCRC
jgi:hypothetical protein